MENNAEYLLQCILDRLESDEYESLGIYTIGGPPGNYQLRTPVNTEIEYLVIGAYLAVASSTITTAGETVATILTNASTSGVGFTSADLFVSQYTVLNFDIIFTSFTGGTSPTIQYFINRKDSAGNYNKIWGPAAVSTATTWNISIGAAVTQGGNPTGTDQSVGLDFGDIIQVGYVTTGAPTSVSQQINIKAKGPIFTSSALTQGTVVITNNNPVTNFTLGTALGATSTGSDMNNVFEGVVLPSSPTINSLIAVDYWMPAGRGSTICVLVLTSASYALIATRRKLARYIPELPRMQPHTHSIPQSRRQSRVLPAESPMVAGYHAQYAGGPEGPYKHENANNEDPANIGRVLRRAARYGR